MIPFAIVKSYISFLDMRQPVYLKVKDPTKVHEELTKQRAMEIVRENGLVLVHEDANGKIWEKPSLEWSTKWKGVFFNTENDLFADINN